MFLAEELPPELVWVFVIPILSSGLALISFWPSWRGHWAGPLLALPAVLVGLTSSWFLIHDKRPDQLLPGLWAYALWPLGLGFSSIFLWAITCIAGKEKR